MALVSERAFDFRDCGSATHRRWLAYESRKSGGTYLSYRTFQVNLVLNGENAGANQSAKPKRLGFVLAMREQLADFLEVPFMDQVSSATEEDRRS